jgi:hypothetical protein
MTACVFFSFFGTCPVLNFNLLVSGSTHGHTDHWSALDSLMLKEDDNGIYYQFR